MSLFYRLWRVLGHSPKLQLALALLLILPSSAGLALDIAEGPTDYRVTANGERISTPATTDYNDLSSTDQRTILAATDPQTTAVTVNRAPNFDTGDVIRYHTSENDALIAALDSTESSIDMSAPTEWPDGESRLYDRYTVSVTPTPEQPASYLTNIIPILIGTLFLFIYYDFGP